MDAAFFLSLSAGIVSVFLMKYGLQALRWLASALYYSIPTRYKAAQRSEDDHIQILVLGDIGRSPRMQYHAISVAKHGRKIDIVAYKETARHPDLIGNDRVSMYALAPQPEWIAWGTLPFFLNIPCKVIQQFWTLFYTMTWATPAAKWIIIQNPPSIPTFHVALIVSLIRGSKVVVDWHNYGHTILAQKSLYSIFVPFYKWYEIILGKYLGNANLAVTDAMARELRGPKFNLKNPVYTLHDRPLDLFQPITSTKARREFLSRLPETKPHVGNILDGTMRLIVSSTSWTPDEDFNILLEALVLYANPSEDDASSEPPSPVLAIITGKGPEKEKYLEMIKQIQDNGRLPGIKILTAWLSNRDYASLLGCADLGVSLHKSSSGVDLPMKVVDMFGAGLPVAAYSAFESFSELVKEGQNGCGFETAAQLTEILKRLFSEKGQDELTRLRKGAIEEGSLRWDEEWDRVMAPIIGIDAKTGVVH
ncbi:beta-1,4-mannosyltransferase, putative [Metarhizium acridum CQMa 102]|uniref:Chitobiosyldiphosphodolichol beta-mannosyltransferase n=1 Tax=Metarhizium acridum (strain CQMa 102) TaxID=655827 RepID=E9E921_METAQ|nr:beta-1,4-mannosyltransferase, putative [Metarhizium acridum CQMa 102]EFY87525.1 beta-1,4-mannosyltransferase, putative [Metarhizium acridum CQMa 102]